MDQRPRPASPSWAALGTRARIWRLLHALWSIVQLGALAHVWRCAATGRRDRLAWAGVALLGSEGAALVVGHGSCPMGPRQETWGDPVPFFELLLPPRAAKAAVPVLAVASAAGIATLVLRRPAPAQRRRAGTRTIAP